MSKIATKHVALIGYRGSGKTTVGALLAIKLGRPFVDTDALVVEAAGRSIAEIFASEGERAFRQREQSAIDRAVNQPPAVISVGGGAVAVDGNMQRLKANATIVWLTGQAEELWSRMAADPESRRTRPDLTARGGLEEVRLMLATRAPLYERWADLRVETGDLTPGEVADAIDVRL